MVGEKLVPIFWVYSIHAVYYTANTHCTYLRTQRQPDGQTDSVGGECTEGKKKKKEQREAKRCQQLFLAKKENKYKVTHLP